MCVCKPEKGWEGCGQYFVFRDHFVRAQNPNQMFLKRDKLISESKVFFLGFSTNKVILIVLLNLAFK